MDIKQIWQQFANTAKESTLKCWEEIKKVAKTTFNVFKIALADFAKAVYEWLCALIEGVFVIIFNLIKVVGAALLAAIKTTLGVLLDKVIEWIKKL